MQRLATTALALALLATPAAAMEIVTNGDFETGDLTDWTNLGDASSFGLSKSAPISGEFSYRVRMTADAEAGGGATLSQPLPTVAGRTYAYSFRLRYDTGTQTFDNSFVASLGAAPLVSLDDFNIFETTLYTGQHIASAANETLAFSFRQNGPGNWRLDDVSVTDLSLPGAVPEPASWAMLIIGFGLAGTALRTTRRRNALAG